MGASSELLAPFQAICPLGIGRDTALASVVLKRSQYGPCVTASW